MGFHIFAFLMAIDTCTAVLTGGRLLQVRVEVVGE
jgi:hypothetical protein